MCVKDCNDCDPCKKASAEKQKFSNRNYFFTDRIEYKDNQKSLVSATDGVSFYLGAEIGAGEPGKYYRVYRSANEIEKIVPLLDNLPITDNHIEMDREPYDIIGYISSSVLEDYSEPDLFKTKRIKNAAAFKDENIRERKRDFSLGYFGELVPAILGAPYDFEQKNLIPHHLAALDKELNGRCGVACKFTDKVPTSMKKKFKEFKFRDADGSINFQELLELISAFPDYVGALSAEEVSELVPMFKDVIEKAKANKESKASEDESRGTKEYDEKEAARKEKDSEDESKGMKKADDRKEKDREDEAAGARKADETKDSEDEMMDEEVIVEKKFTDAHPQLAALRKLAPTAFKDALDKMIEQEVKTHAKVITKARAFMDEAYDYSSKTTKQIMRDALKAANAGEFTDSELPTAFKLLNKFRDYSSNNTQPKSLVEQLTGKEIK